MSGAAGSTMRIALAITAEGAAAVREINGITQALGQAGQAAQQSGAQTATAGAAITQALGQTAQAAKEAGAQAGMAVTAVTQSLGQTAQAAQQIGTQAGAAATAVTQMGGATAALPAATGRAATGLAQVGTAAQGAGRQVGVTAEQMRQLAPQLNDIATQLAMGQSPFMILAAQGGQITQIFGGVRATLGAIGAFLGPAGIAGLLGVTAAGAIALGLERDARALGDMTQRLRATRTDAAAMAREVEAASQSIAAGGSIGGADARAAGRLIAGQRGFAGDAAEIERLVRLSADLARVMGTDVPQAAEQFVAKAIRDPATVARDAAAGGLLGFNDALARQVGLLVASGERGAATRLVIEQMGRASAGAAADLTPMQELWGRIVAGTNAAADAAMRWADHVLRAVTAAAGYPQRLLGASSFDAPRDAPELPRDQQDFARRLGQRESGNRPGEMNRQGFAGLYQFGAARLATLGLYQPGEGEDLRANQWIGRFQIPGFEGVRNIGDFRGNDRAQDAALAAHLADIDRAITRLQREVPDTAGLNRDGLRAVAHLGGTEGMRRWATSGGAQNPADANGTRLSTYYREFGGPTATLPGQVGLIGPVMPPDRQAASDLMRGRSTASDRAADLTAQIGTLERGLAQTEPDSENAQRLRERLRELRAELAGIETPLTRANRALADQFTIMGQAAGAARTLAQAEVEARNEAQRAGLDAEETDQLVAARRRAAQARLTAEFQDGIAARDRDIAGQQAALAVAGQGAAAVEREAIAQQARTEALRTASAGTAEYAAQVAALTERLTAAAAAPRLSSLVQDQAARREQLGLDQSLAGWGVSAADRAAAQAALTARRRLGAAADTEGGRAAVAVEEDLARQGVALERSRATFAEIGRVGEQAFERIGGAITSGTLSLKDMGRIGTSVISELTQAFLRLAVLNPLKNALLGGNAPTLDGVGGLLGRLIGGIGGGTGGSAAGAAAATAMVSDGAGGFVAALHAGGIAGLEATFAKRVPLGLFEGAPRFHGGGMIGADEVPAILQRGEGVFTPEQMAALAPAGEGGVTIHMPVAFQGDSGSDADRAGLLALMRQQMRAEIAQAAPGLVRAAHSYTLAEVGRGGSAARALGRR